MARKRERETDDGEPDEKQHRREEDEESFDDDDDEDFDVVNVDFEWFNFDKAVDFHGVRTLLRQLLDADAALLDLSALADLVLRQHTVGSTVKVDGRASDAYAFLTVLNLRELRAEPAVARLVGYLVDRAGTVRGGGGGGGDLDAVVDVLRTQVQADDAGGAASSSSPSSPPRVGLVLADRLINMPAEIAPPMYAMLVDEVEAAVEDGEPYQFTHYLVVSKAYREVQSSLGAGGGGGGSERKSKKPKESKGSSSAGDGGALLYFHPEDEVLQRRALAYGSYQYKNDHEAVADSKRAFQDMGIQSYGSLILIEAAKFGEAVQALGDYVGSGSA